MVERVIVALNSMSCVVVSNVPSSFGTLGMHKYLALSQPHINVQCSMLLCIILLKTFSHNLVYKCNTEDPVYTCCTNFVAMCVYGGVTLWLF